jgi:hypothetical protein
VRGEIPSVEFEAESRLHGAALALRRFAELGCDITNPFAHLDLTEPNGTTHTLLIEEVLDWLNHPEQIDFIRRQHLAALLQ